MNARLLRVVMLAVVVLASMAVWPAVDAPKPGHTRATFRADGTLLVNDRPVFPIGICMQGYRGEHLKRARQAGFNMVLSQGDFPMQFYDEARREGFYVLGAHYLWATFAGAASNMDLTAKEREGLQLALQYRDHGRTPLENLEKFDNRPEFIGWYIAEEPPAKYVEPLEFMYEIFKSNSPDHIVCLLSADAVWYHVFSNATDVLMIDQYPFRGPRSQPLVNAYTWTRKAVEAMNGKPVWFLMQIFNWAGYDPNVDEELTLAQMRQQMYLALIGGAKGIWMWNYALLMTGRQGKGSKASAELFEERWAKVKTLSQDLTTLSPVLCDGRPTAALRLEWKRPDAVYYRALEHYGKVYLLVANIGDSPAQAGAMGTNYGNFNAYDVSVLIGRNELSSEQNAPDAPPTITIAPHSAGVFLLERRPVQEQRKK